MFRAHQMFRAQFRHPVLYYVLFLQFTHHDFKWNLNLTIQIVGYFETIKVSQDNNHSKRL